MRQAHSRDGKIFVESEPHYHHRNPISPCSSFFSSPDHPGKREVSPLPLSEPLPTHPMKNRHARVSSGWEAALSLHWGRTAARRSAVSRGVGVRVAAGHPQLHQDAGLAHSPSLTMCGCLALGKSCAAQLEQKED